MSHLNPEYRQDHQIYKAHVDEIFEFITVVETALIKGFTPDQAADIIETLKRMKDKSKDNQETFDFLEVAIKVFSERPDPENHKNHHPQRAYVQDGLDKIGQHFLNESNACQSNYAHKDFTAMANWYIQSYRPLAAISGHNIPNIPEHILDQLSSKKQVEAFINKIRDPNFDGSDLSLNFIILSLISDTIDVDPTQDRSRLLSLEARQKLFPTDPSP